MSVVDLFNSMPARFQAEKAAGTAMGILFDLRDVYKRQGLDRREKIASLPQCIHAEV